MNIPKLEVYEVDLLFSVAHSPSTSQQEIAAANSPSTSQQGVSAANALSTCQQEITAVKVLATGTLKCFIFDKTNYSYRDT